MPLITNDVKVNYLTGFCCMHVLTPKQNSLPIIFNLGEVHGDITKPCTTEPNSLSISNFLRHLNILGSKFRIEIYSENFMDHVLLSMAKNPETTKVTWEKQLQNSEKSEGTFRGALGIFNHSENTLSCYYNDLRKKHPDIFKAKCEYPNIIWQYSDARKTFKSRATMHEFYTIENVTDAFHNIESIIQEIAFIDDNYYTNYPTFLKKPSLMDTIEKKRAYMDKVIKNGTKGQDMVTLINIFQLIIDFHENPGNAAETIMNMPAILKQFQKQTVIKDIAEFKLQVKEYITYILNEYDKSDKIFVCYIDFMQMFVLFLKHNTLEHFQKVTETISSLLSTKPMGKYPLYNADSGSAPVNLMIAPSSIILDIYFILRIFKPPQKELICNLAGSKHIEHISFFLTEILHLYDNAIFTAKNEKQCVHLDFDMNLNETLRIKKTESRLMKSKIIRNTQSIRSKSKTRRNSRTKTRIRNKRESKRRLTI